MDELDLKIKKFFSSEAFGVIGASKDPEKYGNKVLRCYLQHHKLVYPVNPNADLIEGIVCLQDLMELPLIVNSISVITAPAISKKIVTQAINKGIQHIWLQPGSEYPEVVAECAKAKVDLICNGPCVLVVMGYKEK